MILFQTKQAVECGLFFYFSFFLKKVLDIHLALMYIYYDRHSTTDKATTDEATTDKVTTVVVRKKIRENRRKEMSRWKKTQQGSAQM